jgi:hypothetical protein
MPKTASQLETDPFLSLLVIGPSGVGKTHLGGTAPKPIYFIVSDDESKLDSALNTDKSFAYDLVNSTDGNKLIAQFEAAIHEARRGITASEYSSVVWDTISTFSDYLVNAELEATDKGNGPDGRQAYGNFNRRIINCVGRFLSLKCHRIVMAHYFEPSKEIEGQKKKEGDGILPGVAGAARQKIPGMFHDVVFMRKISGSEERELLTRISGVYGPRMNGLPGVESVKADIAGLVERLYGVKERKDSAAPKAPPKPPLRVTAAPLKAVAKR